MGLETVVEVPQNKRGQKLYYYLSRLSSEDLDNFCHYLQSPLLGNSPQMSRMVRTIQSRILGTERVTIDADIFEEEFSPDQPLDEKKTKYIRIRLIQLQDKLMEFLSFMDYRQDQNARDIHLLKSLYKRGMEKHFEKIHADIEAQPPVKADGEYLMYRLWRIVVLNDFLTERRAGSESTRLDDVHERSDLLFVHLKLKYGSAVLFKELVGWSDGPLLFMEEVKKYPLNSSLIEHRESVAYSHVLNLFEAFRSKTEAKGGGYENLRSYVTFSDSCDTSEIRDLFTYAQSYCLLQITNGRAEFRQEVIALYNLILGSMQVFEGGLLPGRFYRNAIVNALRVGDLPWAEEFLEEYKNRVAGDEHNLAYYYNKSYIEFHKKNLHLAHEIIYNRINQYTEATYGLIVRSLHARILWELREFRWLLPQIEAFRQYLRRRDDISISERESYELFVKSVSKMCNAVLGNPDRILRIAEKIQREIRDKGKEKVLAWVMHQLDGMVDRNRK